MIRPRELEHEADHLRKEIDRLLEVAADYRARAEAAQGSSAEAGMRHLAERELESIRLLLHRSQLQLVHRSDRRHSAAQNLLRATAGNVNRTPIPDDAARESAAA